MEIIDKTIIWRFLWLPCDIADHLLTNQADLRETKTGTNQDFSWRQFNLGHGK